MPTPREGYKLADGTAVPGTTTIISRFKDSGPLLFWAFKRGKEGAHRLYDNIATDVGTLVHAMVEADLHGHELPTIPSEFANQMVRIDPPAYPFDVPKDQQVMLSMKDAVKNAFDNYQREIKRSKAFFMPLEVQLVSEKYKYGGTPDAIVEFEDVIDIGDWKSSNGVYLDHVIQLAAYRQLWNESHKETPARGARLYRFAKESGAFAEHYYGPETLDLAFKQFLLFREAFELDKQLKRKV